MPHSRRLQLGAFMRPVSIHTSAWRYPGTFPDANFNFAHLKRFIQTLERGKFDAFLMADHLAVMNMPMAALKRSATVTSFDPPALAAVTEHIGLIATASTTYNEPYHIARKFASLDHISNGRAGWNLVTSANPHEALNFGLEEHVEHGARYLRAREFFDIVTGLWDSWADDAFIRDVESGLYFDPEKLHVLNHKGEHLTVRGPLNIARPIQGWPVIVQAGPLGSWKTDHRRDRRSRLHWRQQPGRWPALLCRCERPYAPPWPRSRSSQDIARCLRRDRRYDCRSQGEEEAARQPGSSRQRHRLALRQARHRCLQFRSRWPLAGNPGKQCQQERTRAPRRVGESREDDGAPARPICWRRLGYARDGRHARNHRRSDGGMARVARLRRF
jgi:Luciferase-like monooxygenase